MSPLTAQRLHNAPNSRSAKGSNDVSPTIQSTSWPALQQTLGNQGVQRALRTRAIQAKLRVNRPNDLYEEEADRVAQQVLAEPAHPDVSSAPPRIQRYTTYADGQADAAPASVDRVLAAPGRPLDPALRQDMEQRFGYDFSRVRMHYGAAAEHSARDVNANAYTVGQNMVFGAGRFLPGTLEGRRLIAHELTHVVQQSGSSGTRVTQSHEKPRMSPIKASAIQIARQPKSGTGIHPDAMAFVEDKLRQFYQLLSPRERIRLKRNSTIAIGMAIVDGEPRLVYTVANNATSKEIREAADKLDLHRWTYETDVSGRGTVGAPNDAEQLMTGFAKDNHADLEGLAVSRRVCPDCGMVVSSYKKGQIQISVIEDPIPVPKGPRLAPLKPPAKTVSGEITAKVPPVAPTQGTQSKTEPLTKGGLPEPSSERLTTAHKGEPVEAIHNPAATSSAKGAAMEVGAQVLLSKQLANVREAEAGKAQEALAQLWPEIEQRRSEGFNVTVTLVGEVPNQGDVAALATGVGDSGQVVYFKWMYISAVVPPARTVSNQTTIGPSFGSGDPNLLDTEDLTLEQQIRLQTGDESARRRVQPRPGFHFESSRLVLPGHTESEKVGGPTREAATDEESSRVRSIAGMYRPKFESLFTGHVSIIPRMMMRRLQIELGPGGELVPKMSHLSEPYVYQPYVVHKPMVMSGRFARGEGLPPASEWIWSSMEYPRDGFILEWVKGLGSDLSILWDALFSWRRM